MNTYMRFPEGKERALTLSYDDGVFEDIRLIKTLKPYGIKATFNLNGGAFAEKDADGMGRLSLKQAKELYIDSGHEIAAHGLTHPHLDDLPLSLAIDDVLADRKVLEKEFGTVVRGMAYPFGGYTDALIDGLKKIDIAYARPTTGYNGFDIPKDWHKWPVTCHHNDPKLFELCDKFLDKANNLRPRLFYIWGHSYEFRTRNNWEVIEQFAEKMGNREEIWYATNIEIYDYVEAYRRLIFAVGERRVYNPSAIPIWLTTDGKDIIKVDAGETVKF